MHVKIVCIWCAILMFGEQLGKIYDLNLYTYKKEKGNTYTYKVKNYLRKTNGFYTSNFLKFLTETVFVWFFHIKNKINISIYLFSITVKN